ncbi:MAG: diaminopimelate epimerase [Rhodothermales bacterium]|nr:diaminopimelate epimerase [Rhodothermales bacterium]
MALTVEFTKMDGAGNDFIVIDNRFYNFSDAELRRIALEYCPRRTGIGADGLVALNEPLVVDADARMRYFNADGTAGMCGNGARCLVAYAIGAEINSDQYLIETDSGMYRARADAVGIITLYVPPPRNYRKNIQLDNLTDEASYIWTGTDHVVMEVGDLNETDVAGIGRAIRYDAALAPSGSNVNFVSKSGMGPTEIAVRTYERGVEEETLACGTGAMAAAIVSAFRDMVAATPVVVHMPGGELVVDFDITEEGQIENLSLSGPSNVVYRGTIQLDTSLLKPS